MVPVTDPAIDNSLSVVMERIGAQLKRELVWPSPAAGFAFWAFAQMEMPTFIAQPPGVMEAGFVDRFSEAPILACCGYLLAQGAPQWLEGDDLVGTWAAAAERLSGRDALPTDRQSFFFRPVELLGLALGAAFVEASHPQPVRWLRRLIEEGSDRTDRDPWHMSLVLLARTALGRAPRGRVDLHDDLDATEVAGCWLLASLQPEVAVRAGLTEPCERMENQLLRRLLLTGIPEADVAEYALLYCAVATAVNKRLPVSGAAPQAALTTLTQVLRRFPAIVRNLGTRQRSRPPLANIKDEYDVQDLLRGILRGLFDDVRTEEWTPSRAGLTSRIDLMLKREGIFIETKMTRKSLSQRKVTEELITDKELYRSHPDCKMLVCFVYDPDHRLDNPVALEDEVTDLDGPLPTITIVAPFV